MEKDKYFNPESFWVHSFVVGNLSRKIAMDLDLMNSGEAFISGFLHDFSISLLHREFKAEFVEIYKLVETGVSFDSAEKEILGVTHSDIAKSVLGKWDLPDILIDTVSNHHTPSLSERDKRLTSIVHLADYITSKLDVASCTPDNKFELDESIIETLHFSNEESLNEFIESYREYISEQIDSIRNLL
jgi:HD-like signal output (HDOD) protein